VLETTVEAIVLDGRTRWKVENENNNCPFAEKDFEIVNSLVSSRDERTTYSNDRTSG